MFHVLFNKVKVGKEVLLKEGLLGLLIVCLQFIQKKLRSEPEPTPPPAKKNPIYYKVLYKDALKADPKTPPPRWLGTNKKQLTINWIMPPPNKGSGGHMDIFRCIKALEDAGHICNIYIYSPYNPSSISEIKQLMGSSFPDVKAPMRWLRNNTMVPADAIFATSWETAYIAYSVASNAKRFYFIQDFEPYFYQVSSLYLFAENTYRFGFYGITLGRWLHKKLGSYGMKTDYIPVGADTNTYRLTNSAKRKEILFYARPHTGRRGFEMGVMALDLFHQKHPDYVINVLGSDISDYAIPFPYNNLGVLEHSELNELFNRCAAGLVMSLTNLSLLPLELLACGTIPVINDGENNSMVSDNNFFAYSAPNPHSLAQKLSEVINRPGLSVFAKKGSLSVEGLDWSVSGRKFVRIVEREIKKSD